MLGLIARLESRRRPRRTSRAALVAVALAAAALAAPATGAAATFTVNNTTDLNDGSCDGVHCSLREAINAANAAGGADLIAFNIPGPSPHSIKPVSQLPTITDPVTIDGTTEPDFAGSPVVEISGELAPLESAGLYITAGSSTVRGLVINRFVHGLSNFNSPSGEGIVIQGGGGNVVEGNYLGTDATGTVALPNHTGIRVSFSTNNRIGGASPGARNIVSGNNRYSIYFEASNIGNTAEGNYVGLTASGNAPLPNLAGIVFNSGDQNVVRNNVIAANARPGIEVIGGNDNLIHDNLIGTDPAGNPVFGNGAGVQLFSASNNIVRDNTISGNSFSGVLINSTLPANTATNNVIQGNEITRNGSGVDIGTVGGHSGNRIGGSAAGTGNVIAFNRGPGVAISDGNTRNSVLSNSIHDNLLLGIDSAATA
jgi:CSLREA domain-containing protein